MNKIVLIALALIVIVIIAFVAFRVAGSNQQSPQNHQSTYITGYTTSPTTSIKSSYANQSQPSFLPSCGSSTQLLTLSPIPVNQISTVIPLGNFAPPGHILPTPHIYLRYLTNASGTTLKTNIYSPANIVITQITKMGTVSGGTANVSSIYYKLDFKICGDISQPNTGVVGYLILLSTLSGKLGNAFNASNAGFNETSNVGGGTIQYNYLKAVDVNVTEGEIIGTGGGFASSPSALDFGLKDFRTQPGVEANPARWNYNDTYDLHTVCPIDYFPSNISSALYSKLGTFGGVLVNVNSPRCGTVYQDIAGSAQGTWFLNTTPPNNVYTIMNLLSLAHSNFNHTQPVIVMGDSLHGLGFYTDAVYNITPQTTGNVNIDFSDVTPNGKIYCYQSYSNNNPSVTPLVTIIQLINSNTLKIGRLNGTSCGSGPWQFSSYLDFVR